jgi:mannose-1-phosphate guanylyltransferase
MKYSLWLLRAAGVDELVLNSHWKAEQISSLASEVSSSSLRVHVSHEEGTPLGSGGGIWKARGWLDQRAVGDNDSFFVANGDEVILPHDPSVLASFKRAHSESDALATILVMKHPLVGTQFGGVWCSSSGDVRGFGKDGSKFGADSVGYHYIGLLLLSPRVFDYMPEGESNILYDTLAAAIAAREKVRVVVSEFTWFETGNPRDFLHATGEALTLLDCASRSGAVDVATSPLKDKGLRNAALALREITSEYWRRGTVLERSGSALVLHAPGAALSGSVSGFAVLEEGAVVSSAVSNVVVMPGVSVTTPRSDEICL